MWEAALHWAFADTDTSFWEPWRAPSSAAFQPALHFELQLGAEGQASPGLQPQPLEPGRCLLGDLVICSRTRQQ